MTETVAAAGREGWAPPFPLALHQVVKSERFRHAFRDFLGKVWMGMELQPEKNLPPGGRDSAEWMIEEISFPKGDQVVLMLRRLLPDGDYHPNGEVCWYRQNGMAYQSHMRYTGCMFTTFVRATAR